MVSFLRAIALVSLLLPSHGRLLLRDGESNLGSVVPPVNQALSKCSRGSVPAAAEVDHNGTSFLRRKALRGDADSKDFDLAARQANRLLSFREQFVCTAECAAQEPQLEQTMSSLVPGNSSGLDMVKLLTGFCSAERSCKDPFVMVVLHEGDVFVKGCQLDLHNEGHYLIGPEDLSLVLVSLLSVQKIAPLPEVPIAFGMYLSDYTCLQDRHLVGPGVPMFSYLGRDTSWTIPWPSSFNLAAIYETTEWEKTSTALDWNKRSPQAYWVGAVTGPWEFAADEALEAIPRIKLLSLSHKNPQLLKAEYTSVASYGISWVQDASGSVAGWGSKAHKTIEDITGIPMSPYRSLAEWAGYKYYMNIDGVVLGGRVSKLLALGGVVLQQEAGYSEFFSALLKPGKHYIPVKYDLSDLTDKIEWLQKNDALAQKIAERSRKLAKQRMRFEDAVCYMWRALEVIGSRTAHGKTSGKAVSKFLDEQDFKRVSVKDGGLRETLSGFWGRANLEDVATGSRVMTPRGIELMKWVWSRFSDLHERVHKPQQGP